MFASEQYDDYLVKLFFEKQTVPTCIYKYRPFTQYSIKNLVSNSLWFSYVDEFNDPFESKLTAPIDMWLKEESAEGKQTKKEDLEPLAKHYCELLEKNKHLLTACSFAKEPSNILMWSHYANSHTGFCLEFTPVKDFNFFYSLFPIQYEREFKPAELISNETNILDQLFIRKSRYWKYEDEFRLIKRERKNYEYAPAALSAVIFGANTSKEDIQLVKRILGSSVQYRKCEINPYSQSIEVFPDEGE